MKIILPLFTLGLLLFYNAATGAESQTLDIVSQNLNRFFDDRDDGNKGPQLSHKRYQQRLAQLANKIALDFQFADVIALQEVENKSILQQLSRRLKTRHGQDYQPILIEGNDISGMDVGYLVKKSFHIRGVKPLFSNTPIGRKEGRLFSRPPLAVKLCQRQCLTIVNVHLRSMRGLRSSDSSNRVATKRRLQAEALARWINIFQRQQPDQGLLIIGDFNALQPSDEYSDIIGTLLGNPDQRRPKWKSPDLIERDLIDATLRLPPGERYSYIYKGKKQQLDYLLLSRNLENNIESINFSSIDYSFSDHAALKARIRLD